MHKKTLIGIGFSIFLILSLSFVHSLQEFTVYEGEFFALNVSATDADNNPLTYIYSYPFNSKGEWNITYDDAGIYYSNITVSDGESSVTDTLKIIVIDVNIPPKITLIQPETYDRNLVIDETEYINFQIETSDYENKDISVKWYLNSLLALENENEFVFNTNYDSFGQYNLKVVVSDGLNESQILWNIHVKNKNQLPKFNIPSTITINETDLLDLNNIASDADGDNLVYSFGKQVNASGIFKTDYDSSGTYNINATVFDGTNTTTKKLKVTVLNVNRPPNRFSVPDYFISEDNKLNIQFDFSDPDGDKLDIVGGNYPNDAKINSDQMTWQPGFDYVNSNNVFLYFSDWTRKQEFYVIASDGEFNVSARFNVYVKDNNRPPEFLKNPVSNYTVDEGEEVLIHPEAQDLDNNKLDYEYSGFMDSEKYKTNFNDGGKHFIYVTSSDRFDHVEKEFVLNVNEVNQNPRIDSDNEINIKEGNRLIINFKTDDKDSDFVSFWVANTPDGSKYYNNTFDWTPSFDYSNGEVKSTTIILTVSDGKVTVIKEFKINVENVNRPPVIVKKFPVGDANAIVGDIVNLRIEAYDPDSNPLTVKWNFGFGDSISAGNEITRRFTSPGEKKIKVYVTDGKETVTEEFKVHVRKLVVLNANVQTVEFQNVNIVDRIP